MLFVFLAEGGRIRYKVHFDDKGKRIVSGHHVAFDTVVEKMHVYVGARVVARYPNTWVFSPGILAEIPTRSNRDRCVVKSSLFLNAGEGLSRMDRDV